MIIRLEKPWHPILVQFYVRTVIETIHLMTPTGPLTMFWFITSSSISMSIEILTSSFVLLEIVESLHPVWMLFPPMPCSDLLFQTHNHLKVVDTRIHLHRYSFVFWALAIIDIFRSEVLDPFWIFTSLRPHLYFYSFCSSQFDAQPPSFHRFIV